jgi:SSS family solute:Na+ symporter
MTTLDLSIIFTYLLAMLGIGLYYRRYAGQGLETFFLAGRNIPGWLNGVSYAAAMVSADAATAYGGLAVVTGVFVCWWYLSRFGLALFVGAVLFALYWRRLGFFTSLEFYELRFAGNAAALMRLWIAFRTSFVAMAAWTGITLLAAAKILGPTLGLSTTQSMLLIVPVSFAYVFLSGYKGVVVSNFIQMAIFLVGAGCLALKTLFHFGGPSDLARKLSEIGVGGGEMLNLFPPAEHTVFPLAAALAWLVGQTIGYGGDAAPMGGAMEGQRILSSRTPRSAVHMYVVTALTMFTLVLLVSLPCIAAPLLWPSLLEPAADRELAYGLLMKELLPSGALGLVAAAMLAGVMSTVGDNLNFGSQVMVNDLYRRWVVRGKSEKHYLMAGKLCMLIILALSLTVVYHTRIIFDVAVFMLQLSSAELPANWAQWWWWRFNSKARLAASFGGGLIFCAVVLGPKILTGAGFEWAKALIIPWWYQTFLVMGLTTILWVSVALLSRPDPPEVLDRFYLRAQPLGSWGVVRQRLGKEMSSYSPSVAHGWKTIGKGFSLALCGATAASFFILAISSLFVARNQVAIALLIAAGLLLALFGRFLSVYLDHLEDPGSLREWKESANMREV